ncbi:hypothetical protein DER44DRAFT_884044 [Fusarium oxysporum]|nr:hypothetical protein DER44DRAFT_884044 [Fusarium oxysporum]
MNCLSQPRPFSSIVFISATQDNLWKERGYDLKDVKALDSAKLERRDEHGIAHGIGPRRIYHFETGLWVDSNENFYDRVTDEEVDDPFEKREPPNDDSWTAQGQRTWDSEMGLWTDGDGKLKKFATERELPERPEVPDEHEDSDLNIDMQPFYDREEDEYLNWGRDAQGDVWYWQVSGTAGHATETLRRYSIEDNPVVSDVYVRMNLPKQADFEVWSNVPWSELRMARESFHTVF